MHQLLTIKMEIFGYIMAVFIGILLGLIGGGGSILTVPILVYLLDIEPQVATGYSLFVVGCTSAFGAMAYVKNKLVDFDMVLLFGLPSIVSVYLTRAFIVPAIPNIIFQTETFTLGKNLMLMLLFAVLMLFSAYKMIKPAANVFATEVPKSKVLTTIMQGILIGFLISLVGAGGGFLIIPALTLVNGLEIKKAIGTSLFIIALNSSLGFTASKFPPPIAWSLLLTVTGLAVIGIFIGSALATKINGKKLKPAFGWFVLIMGAYIILHELLY